MENPIMADGGTDTFMADEFILYLFICLYYFNVFCFQFVVKMFWAFTLF